MRRNLGISGNEYIYIYNIEKIARVQVATVQVVDNVRQLHAVLIALVTEF